MKNDESMEQERIIFVFVKKSGISVFTYCPDLSTIKSPFIESSLSTVSYYKLSFLHLLKIEHLSTYHAKSDNATKDIVKT